MGRGRNSQVYRVRQLPLHLENRGVIATFLATISPALGAVDNIRVFSLAQEKANSKTATVSFKTLPAIFDNDEQQWTLQAEVLGIRNIIVDTHFRDFTVLNEPQHHLHTVDCVAISGLASHPFGSWKHREPGSDFMWLRDRLPQDVPQLRSLIYGYDTKLFKSHSFQDLDDIAWSFIASLKELRRSLPPTKPLIFLAHSLGGIVLKRALVLLALEGNDEEKMILESVKGLVFFGVPHRGMEVSHFLAMVARQPNEDLISRALSPDSALLPELDKQFSEIALRIDPNIRFVYETAESQMTEQTSTGKWVRSETSYAVLVNKDSAVPPGTLRRNAIAVNKDHSNMVKFGEDDPVYQILMSFIFDLSKDTDSQIRSQVDPTSLNPVQRGVRTFSTIPFPQDPGFVGREEILAQLESEFANPKSQRWASLYGLGGIGKSQIAIEHSYRQKERCPQISTFWIHASSKARLEQSYAEIATTVEIPGTGDGKVDTLQLVSKWLASPDSGSWLLILDNADDATVLLDLSANDTGTVAGSAQHRLLDLLPRVQHGAVLITTRDRTCALTLTGHRGTPIEVLSMTLDESVNLLRIVLPTAPQEEASELVEELENVPLAISQASAYIKSVPLVSIPKYLAMFRRSDKDQADLLDKDEGDLRRDSGVPNAVITSWELSFNQIRKRTPDSANLLSLMSCFSRQAIPQFLIQGDVDEIAFYDRINPLLSFSLIRAEIGDDTFEMHRLVQTAMRHWLRSEGSDQLWKERAIERVAHHFPAMRNQAQHWPLCEALMSHADEVILHTASSKEFQLRLAEIHVFTAGYLVQRKGHARLAEERLTDALHIQREYFNEDSDVINVTLAVLVDVYRNLSKSEEARLLQESILKRNLEKWGSEHPESLNAMQGLALSHGVSGQFQKAEDLLKRVFEVRERLLDPEDPHFLQVDFLASGHELANNQLDQGKYDQAEKLSTRILEISTRCHGVEHRITLGAMHLLSRSFLQQQKTKEAENMIAQAIPIDTKVFGPSHWKTLDARKLLAEVYYRQRKLGEAEEICIQCLGISQKVYGPQDYIIIDTNNLLGLIYQDQGRFTDALRLGREAVESIMKTLGADHPNTLNCMCNLAFCFYEMGDKDQATQLMTEVLDKRKEVLHADHPHTTDSVKWLAIFKNKKTEEGKSEEEETEEWETEEEGSEEEQREECETEEEGNENAEIKEKEGKEERAEKTAS